MTTSILLLAGDEWFLRELVSFLSHEDAVCLTLLAIECKWTSLTHALLYKPLPTRAISTQKLADYTAERGWWHLLALVREQDVRLCLGNKRVSLDVQESAFARCQRIQRSFPRPFPAKVMYAAVRRGSLDEVKWLHTCTKIQYGCFYWYEHNTSERESIYHCAIKAHHLDVLEWLLDLHERTAGGLKVMLRLKDSALEVVCWRKGQYLHAAISDEHLVQHVDITKHWYSSPIELCPLMDWAAMRGDLSLLEKLHSDPILTTTCTYRAMCHGANAGHLDVVCWLHEHRSEHVNHISEVLTMATSGEQVAVLDWLHVHFDLQEFVAKIYRKTAQPRRFKAMIWFLRNFKNIMRHAEPPPVYELTGAPLELFQLLFDMYDLSVDAQSVKVAVRSGNFELVRWLVEKDAQAVVGNDADRFKLLTFAIDGGNIDLVRWCIEELDTWFNGCALQATTKKHVLMAKYLWEKLRERNEVIHNEDQMLLTAVQRGSLELVQWCVEDLGAWDPSVLQQAVSCGNYAIFKYFVAKSEERGESDTTMHLKQNGVDARCIVRMLCDDRVEDEMIDWILTNCPDTGYQVRALDVERLKRKPWHTLRKMLHYHPSLCYHIRNLPLRAVQEGSLNDFKRLEAIKYPRLFTKKTLNAILDNSRDEILMCWFLTRSGISLVKDQRITKWAAKYGVVQLLDLLRDAARGMSDEGLFIKFLGTVVWEAIRCDQVSTLRWVERQELSQQARARLWTSKLTKLATGCAHLASLAWLRDCGLLNVDNKSV
ncbi:hypothetical protein Poli38472_010110 [Pythium oligandrum]|uniref:Ankyrin repeat-containing domain n=1 Tax=Pythium oligandrum TaxID=41045 RepID=A0A8K1C8C8_PYTOL|nr:hypothetical protein Poli38472_010110 [Pythium oligandrum]|eukprot:TMW58551.1 hypothetical protein Poli38472_010110 [Pythium oligandrum]